MPTQPSEIDFLVDIINDKLVGSVITGAAVSADKESFGFIFAKDPHNMPVEKKVCWIDMDAEGNGPGWISIEDKDD